LNEGEIATSVVILEHNFMSYAFLSANSGEMARGGSSEYVIHKSILESGKQGIKNLLLGGGLSSDENDSLLQFKSKFTKNEVAEYAIGGLVINQEVYDQLNQVTIRKNPSLENMKFFLKYRLQPSN
jgi:hypothetical protein